MIYVITTVGLIVICGGAILIGRAFSRWLDRQERKYNP